MKAAVFAFSRQGCQTAHRVYSFLSAGECRTYAAPRLCEPGFSPIMQPSGPFYAEQFRWADALVFVGACGIAVRAIAPHIKDKRTDPAVVCIDEQGRFVIPLLSGHIGGANRLAQELALKLGAQAVITTATDLNGRFSVDTWAAQQGYLIDSMEKAKAVSAAILERDLPLCSDLPLAELPPGVFAGEQGSLGISVGWSVRDPFEVTLHIIPRVLHIGIGCRRGTPACTISGAVDQVCAQNGIDTRAVKGISSIDLKSDESGLLDCCRERRWPLTFYSAQELESVQGSFSASAFVQSVTGVDNVCERAALARADRLLVRKTAIDGVTVAVAAENQEVCFG